MKKMIRYSTVFICSFISVESFANRTISIPLSSANLSVSNASPVAVTYNLVCKDKNGNVALTKSSEVLAAGKTFSYSGSANAAQCASGFNLGMSSGFINGMISCSSMMGTPLAGVAGFCASGSHVCGISEYSDNKGTMTGGSSSFIQPPTTWTARFWDMPSASYITQTMTDGVTTHFPMTPMSMPDSNLWCSADASGGAHLDGCQVNDSTMSPTIWNALCCPDVGVPAVCAVEINTSSTPAQGFLSSPQFNGGKAF